MDIYSNEKADLSDTDTDEYVDLINRLSMIRQINDFCFSIDDRHILISSNIGEYSRIWAIPSGGGFPRLASSLNRGDVKGMLLSPDGSLLAFSVDIQGAEEVELMVMSVEDGTPVSLVKEGLMPPAHFCWSPDSTKIAYICQEKGKSQLAFVDLETGDINVLTRSEDPKQEPHWSWDGKYILYTSFGGVKNSHIYIYSLESGQIRNLTSFLEGLNSGGKFSPDCRTVGFTSDARGIKNVALMNLDRDGIRWLENKNIEQTFLTWNKTGSHFAFLRNERGKLTLQESDYPPTKIKRLTTAGYYGTRVRYGNTGDLVAVSLYNEVSPSDIYVRKEKTLRKVTESAPFSLDNEKFIEPMELSYESFDGQMINSLYYRPDEKNEFPVLIWLHGGPTSQHFQGWNLFAQLCIKNGIGLFAPDVRGSSGYGKDFENLNYHDWGGGDLADVAQGARFIRDREQNPQMRLFVGGGSYGGYLTMMALTKHPELWSAGINWMGPVNLENLYYNTAPRLKPILEIFFGFKKPEEDPAFYYNRSPVNFIDQLSCPLLMIYGKNDPRVPISEIYQLRNELQNNGKVYKEEVFDDEGHSMNRTDNRIAYYSSIIGFLRQFTHSEQLF